MIHKMLAASLTVACLTTTSLVPSYAATKEKELYFYPKNKWIIESVNDNSCVISNQLNNGYKIKIAGTKTGFTNINIDFRQNSFKSDEKYDVKYSIPGITEKVITTKAFKPNLLVSDLREEKEFADALSKASTLDVKIKNTEFRVYLTGFVSKMAEYNNCLTPAVEKIAVLDIPQQPKEIKGNVAPLPPLKMSSYSQENISEQSKEAAQSKFSPAANSGSYTQELNRQMKEESKKYQKDEITLEEEIVTEEVTEPTENVTSEHFESEKATYNVTKLEPMSVDLTKAAQESGNSDSSLHMSNKISEMEKQISALKSENSMLDKELKNTLQDSRDERLSVSSDNWNLERATMKFNESERQIMRLGRQLQTQKAQCQQEKTELENMLFDPTLTDQQQLANLASLEAELDKVNDDMYRQQRQYEERIKLLEQQLVTQ